jgi:hypothetical protein
LRFKKSEESNIFKKPAPIPVTSEKEAEPPAKKRRTIKKKKKVEKIDIHDEVEDLIIMYTRYREMFS